MNLALSLLPVLIAQTAPEIPNMLPSYQRCYDTILAMLNQAGPVVFGLFGVIVSASLVMTLIRRITH